ncbi:MAG: hypothetical protein WBE37_26735 [Bryobacteraceae bacterium]
MDSPRDRFVKRKFGDGTFASGGTVLFSERLSALIYLTEDDIARAWGFLHRLHEPRVDAKARNL